MQLRLLGETCSASALHTMYRHSLDSLVANHEILCCAAPYQLSYAPDTVPDAIIMNILEDNIIWAADSVVISVDDSSSYRRGPQMLNRVNIVGLSRTDSYD